MADLSKDEIKKFIKSKIAELMNINADDIDDDAEFVEQVGVSSIMLVDMLVSAEEEYGVDLETGFDLKEPLTVNILADKITGLKGEN